MLLMGVLGCFHQPLEEKTQIIAESVRGTEGSTLNNALKTRHQQRKWTQITAFITVESKSTFFFFKLYASHGMGGYLSTWTTKEQLTNMCLRHRTKLKWEENDSEDDYSQTFYDPRWVFNPQTRFVARFSLAEGCTCSGMFGIIWTWATPWHTRAQTYKHTHVHTHARTHAGAHFAKWFSSRGNFCLGSF